MSVAKIMIDQRYLRNSKEDLNIFILKDTLSFYKGIQFLLVLEMYSVMLFSHFVSAQLQDQFLRLEEVGQVDHRVIAATACTVASTYS